MSIFEKPGEVLFNFAHLSCGAMDKIKSIGYYDAPASKGHHLAVKGGLAAHSLNVTRRLIDISDALEVAWSRDESPYLVGMLHDLVTC